MSHLFASKNLNLRFINMIKNASSRHTATVIEGDHITKSYIDYYMWIFSLQNGTGIPYQIEGHQQYLLEHALQFSS